MGRNWATLVVLSFFLTLLGHGEGDESLKGDSPVVQESKRALPLKVRILLEQREFFRPLSLRASELKVNGVALQGSELNCRFRDGWICQGKNKKLKFEGRIVVQSGEGFIHIGKAFYRDTIHLIPVRDRKLMIVNELDMESYLVGIVNSEISSKYPKEAIKAQVVAARSYALACLKERRARQMEYDLDSTDMDQVYKGAHVEDANSHFAVQETRGKVLLNSGKVVKAYYHASSGGTLERPETVWGSKNTLEGSIYSLRSPPEASDDRFRWKVSIGPWFGFKIPGLGALRDFQIVERTEGERVQKVYLVGDNGSRVLKGSEFRKLLGGRWIKSTLFDVEPKGSGWLLEGRGFGHGVGLSQMGARNLAEKGWNYKKILSAYYPGARISGESAPLNKPAFQRDLFSMGVR